MCGGYPKRELPDPVRKKKGLERPSKGGEQNAQIEKKRGVSYKNIKQNEHDTCNSKKESQKKLLKKNHAG